MGCTPHGGTHLSFTFHAEYAFFMDEGLGCRQLKVLALGLGELSGEACVHEEACDSCLLVSCLSGTRSACTSVLSVTSPVMKTLFCPKSRKSQKETIIAKKTQVPA